MRRYHHGLARGFAAAVCIAALAACSSGGSSTGNKGSGGLPSQAVQSEVAASVASSITSQITSMTSFGSSAFLDLFNRVSPGGNVPAVNLAKLLAKRGGTHIREGTDCPAITPAEIVDSDGDGIPDNVTETWGSDCADTSGGEIFSISGSISISDATPNTPDLAYNSNIDNLEISESGSEANLSIGINGTLGVSETLSSISVAANYTYNFAETSPNAVTEAVTEKLTSTYSFPATSSLLVEGDSLPAGTFNISGQETFTVNNTTYAFTVATPTPLSVDPSCPTGVTSGVVTVGFSGQGATGSATITWTACGTYTITDS
jgi:hypothetical protein